MTDIAVIVPHPDDESALCAGLILRAQAKGLKVAVVFVTSGAHGRTLGLVAQDKLAAARRKEAEFACRTLGANSVHFLGYDDFDPRSGKFSTWPGAKKKILSRLRVSPETIVVGFPPNGMNGHPDHVRCSALAVEVAQERNATMLYVTRPSAKTSLGMVSYVPEKKRQQRHLPATHVMTVTPAEMEVKLLALSGYRTQAISILDYIRQEQGNLFDEYYAIPRDATPGARKVLTRTLRFTRV